MDYQSRRLIPQHLQNGFVKGLSPLITVLSKWGLSPNLYTVAGVIITSFAAAAFIIGHIRLAGILILTGGLCDTIDGLIARTTGKASRFGSLLDSCFDRYSEFIMFLGITVCFIYRKDYATVVSAFLALCGSFMVSYTRARAETLGFEARMGFMQRPERIVIIGLGALIHITTFKFAIGLVALLANVTAFQRIRSAFKQDLAGIKKQYRESKELNNYEI